MPFTPFQSGHKPVPSNKKVGNSAMNDHTKSAAKPTPAAVKPLGKKKK